MTLPTQITVKGIGWVLPKSTGAGAEVLTQPDWGKLGDEGNTPLAGFSPRSHLMSVKGYLDPSSAYLLAAASLALGEHDGSVGGVRGDVGLSTLTRYGAVVSGFRFYEQFLKKGARHASPLLFPHGYSNTPGNLAAIEFGFGGPHMVLFGMTDPTEALAFACARLLKGEAKGMLVGAYEATNDDALPDSQKDTVLNGAIALWLVADAAEGEGIVGLPAGGWPAGGEACAAGSVAGLLAVIQQLGKESGNDVG